LLYWLSYYFSHLLSIDHKCTHHCYFPTSTQTTAQTWRRGGILQRGVLGLRWPPDICMWNLEPSDAELFENYFTLCVFRISILLLIFVCYLALVSASILVINPFLSFPNLSNVVGGTHKYCFPLHQWWSSFSMCDSAYPYCTRDGTRRRSKVIKDSSSIPVWQNHLGNGVHCRINLSDSRRSDNTINTHKYNTIYWSSNRSYYNLGLCIGYTEEIWSQNFASKDKSEFVEAISLNGQDIPFALKENVIHRHSKHEDPSTESIPHQFGLPTDNPHRHRRQEETVPHLHTEDNKSKAWATMLSKTYPRWPKRSPLDMQRFYQD
jgi:hypothetical protein